jgi:hypothetical protein
MLAVIDPLTAGVVLVAKMMNPPAVWLSAASATVPPTDAVMGVIATRLRVLVP